jgi:Pectate lyase superfamily protein
MPLVGIPKNKQQKYRSLSTQRKWQTRTPIKDVPTKNKTKTHMALKTLPQVSDLNWGTPLNAHIGQLQSSVDGGINKFEQFAQRPTTLTTDDAGKTYLYTQTGNIHQWTGTAWKVLNESVVNVKDYGAVGDGVTDDTAKIQSVIDNFAASTGIDYQTPNGRNRKIFFPQGKYRITSTLNLGSNGSDQKTRFNTHLLFENRNNSFSDEGTLFIGETGINPVIETTGSDGITLENIGIIQGTNNPSLIGILQARPSPVGRSAFRHLYINLFIRLKSHLTANGGLGSIGLINIGSEEGNNNNIEIWANTPLVISDSANLKFTNKDLTGLKTHIVTSGLGFSFEPSNSTTMPTFSGHTRFCSWDYFSPIILLSGQVVAGIDFQNLFMVKFLPSQLRGLAIGPNTGDGTTASGVYCYAIETGNLIAGVKMHVQMEGCPKLLLINGSVEHCDFNVALAGDNNNGNFNDDVFPFIKLAQNGLFPDFGIVHWISNTVMRINVGRGGSPIIKSPLIGLEPKTNNPLDLTITNSEFLLSSRSASFYTNKYSKKHIQKGIFKICNNSTFKIIDKEIKIGENSLATSIIKREIPVNSTTITKILEIELPTVVAGSSSFGGSCEISGVCTSARSGFESQSSVYFNARFSFVVQNSDGSIQLSPISLNLDPVVNFNPNFNSITALGLTISSANNVIKLNSQPTESGQNNIPVNISADVKIHYSDAFLDNIIIDY